MWFLGNTLFEKYPSELPTPRGTVGTEQTRGHTGMLKLGSAVNTCTLCPREAEAGRL